MEERKRDMEEMEKQNATDRQAIESLKALVIEGTNLELLPMHPNLRRLLRWSQDKGEVEWKSTQSVQYVFWIISPTKQLNKKHVNGDDIAVLMTFLSEFAVLRIYNQIPVRSVAFASANQAVMLHFLRPKQKKDAKMSVR